MYNKNKIYELIYSGKINHNDIIKIDRLLQDKIIYIGNYKTLTDVIKQIELKILITDMGNCFKIELINLKGEDFLLNNSQ